MRARQTAARLAADAEPAPDPPDGGPPHAIDEAAYCRLRRDLISWPAQRLDALRRDGQVDEALQRRVEAGLDAEESAH